MKVGVDGKRFEFHGTPSLWDAKKIKGKITGNSSLYILEDEVSLLKPWPEEDSLACY